MIKYYLYLVILSISLPFLAQGYEEMIPAQNIKSIQLYNPSTQNQSPFIAEDEYFVLSFDDISSSYNRYNYFIKHYDRNWEDSGLFESEYLNGYFTDVIDTYDPSYNTLQPYIHYEMKFPNAKVQTKISGNFALFVYTTDKNNPLFSVRFSVFENAAAVGITQDIFNAGSTKNLPNQKLEVIATSQNEFNLMQNVQNTSLTILKNNNWNDAISNIKPQFVFNNSLEFKQNELAFVGGNENLWFDTKNIDIHSLTTEKIIQNEDIFDTYLYANHPYPESYYLNPDVNGAFYIRRNDLGTERNSSSEGDYTRVHFALVMPEMLEQQVYVVGLFNNYAMNETNVMSYNPEGYYEATLLLKQGYYNYQYVGKDDKGNLDFTLNSNFWQTENLYTALLYYRNFSENYDRLIGLGEN